MCVTSGSSSSNSNDRECKQQESYYESQLLLLLWQSILHTSILRFIHKIFSVIRYTQISERSYYGLLYSTVVCAISCTICAKNVARWRQHTFELSYWSVASVPAKSSPYKFPFRNVRNTRPPTQTKSNPNRHTVPIHCCYLEIRCRLLCSHSRSPTDATQEHIHKFSFAVAAASFTWSLFFSLRLLWLAACTMYVCTTICVVNLSQDWVNISGTFHLCASTSENRYIHIYVHV